MLTDACIDFPLFSLGGFFPFYEGYRFFFLEAFLFVVLVCDSGRDTLPVNPEADIHV